MKIKTVDAAILAIKYRHRNFHRKTLVGAALRATSRLFGYAAQPGKLIK